VALLLDAGLIPLRDRDGLTPLMFAAAGGRWICKALLARGRMWRPPSVPRRGRYAPGLRPSGAAGGEGGGTGSDAAVDRGTRW
jgi:hypothetical protein